MKSPEEHREGHLGPLGLDALGAVVERYARPCATGLATVIRKKWQLWVLEAPARVRVRPWAELSFYETRLEQMDDARLRPARLLSSGSRGGGIWELDLEDVSTASPAQWCDRDFECACYALGSWAARSESASLLVVSNATWRSTRTFAVESAWAERVEVLRPSLDERVLRDLDDLPSTETCLGRLESLPTVSSWAEATIDGLGFEDCTGARRLVVQAAGGVLTGPPGCDLASVIASAIFLPQRFAPDFNPVSVERIGVEAYLRGWSESDRSGTPSEQVLIAYRAASQLRVRRRLKFLSSVVAQSARLARVERDAGMELTQLARRYLTLLPLQK